MGFEVYEGGCHLAPIAKLERTFAQPAARDYADRIRGAAIDFDEGDQSFAIPAAWVLYTQPAATERGQANAQHLPGAEMTVDYPGFFQQFIESWHGDWHLLC
jgi:hypothetical protein